MMFKSCLFLSREYDFNILNIFFIKQKDILFNKIYIICGCYFADYLKIKVSTSVHVITNYLTSQKSSLG